MACVNDQPLLERYLDGELSGALTFRVESALETCEHCRATLDELSTIKLAVQSDITAAVEAAPLDGLWARIDAQLNLDNEMVQPRSWLDRIKGWWEGQRTELVLGAVVATCAVLLAVWIGGSLNVQLPVPEAPTAVAPVRQLAPANNRLVVESTEVREGVVIIDVDPDDPAAPAIVWHLVDAELEEDKS